jgi:hypothetical protein
MASLSFSAAFLTIFSEDLAAVCKSAFNRKCNRKGLKVGKLAECEKIRIEDEKLYHQFNFFGQTKAFSYRINCILRNICLIKKYITY